jgi:hypothetical protein
LGLRSNYTRLVLAHGMAVNCGKECPIFMSSHPKSLNASVSAENESIFRPTVKHVSHSAIPIGRCLKDRSRSRGHSLYLDASRNASDGKGPICSAPHWCGERCFLRVTRHREPGLDRPGDRVRSHSAFHLLRNPGFEINYVQTDHLRRESRSAFSPVNWNK